MRIATSDLREAIAAVSNVYCPHDVAILESNRGIDAELEASSGRNAHSVKLRYSTPVKIDAGHFDNLLLFMTCIDGSAEATQGRNSIHWERGATLPLSPNLPSKLSFDRRFWQSSIRLEKSFVEETCCRLLNRPLDRPIRFDLVPFNAHLEMVWQQAVQTLRSLGSADLPAGSAALVRLEEFLALLILESHPHNYSTPLTKECMSASPRLVREAEQLMISAGPNISVSKVAKELRVSLRSLQLGFREVRQMTPTQVHRQIRLQHARKALLNPTSSTTVTSVALSVGFVHLARFSEYYQTAFKEPPSRTLRRSRH
jgi:AraC-like DNA-binding protein